MKNAGDVLTIDELALYLKISKSTLYKLVREGKIPSQKVGRHWRFRKVAIDRWLEDLPAEEALVKTPTKPARLSSRKESR
ncbi:MAG: helix-turn-helix domain-containing protein [Syntrophorhabdales bacterium]